MRAAATDPGRLALTQEGFEYARARIGARLAWRPAGPAWRRLQAARGPNAWIAVARGAAFAPYLSGVAATATLDVLDAAFRAQWRQRVEELARWSPLAWQAAVRWTARLPDLPLLLHLRHGGAVPTWLAQEPDLNSAAAPPRPTASGAGPTASKPPPATAAARPGRVASLPAPLAAWSERWRLAWPADRGTAPLAQWAARRGPELHRLAQAAAPDAAAAALAARLLADVHHSGAGAPCVAPFAFLALLALDLRQLRSSAVQAWWAQEGCA